VGKVCSMCGGNEMRIGYQWENMKERGHSEDQDICERIILKWMLEK
jgi:hypothetical protein